MPPAARSVTQYCDKCGQHIDSLTDERSHPITVPYPKAHVNDGDYGERKGTLYMQYRVKGSIVRRTSKVARGWGRWVWPPTPPRPMDRETNVQRERKTIDHVETGPYIHWLSQMRPKDCIHRVDKNVIGFGESSPEEEFALALSESHPAGHLSLLDDGSIAEVAGLVADALDATFSLVRNDEGEPLEFELISAAPDGEPIVHARVILRENEGGFFTIAGWTPGASDST